MDLSNKFLISSSYGLRELSVSEKDYKDFIANGQNLMFLTVVWGDKKWEENFFTNLALCEKYEIPVIVYDNVMNDLSEKLTEEDVKKYTAAYSSSPVYSGNGFADEPGPEQYPALAHIVGTYLRVSLISVRLSIFYHFTRLISFSGILIMRNILSLSRKPYL